MIPDNRLPYSIPARVCLCAALATLLFLASGGCAGRAPAERVEFTRVCMGVEARLVFFASRPDEATATAGEVFALLAGLDAAMSDYRTDSELNRLSDAAGGPPTGISPDLFDVLNAARDIARASDGAYDPTVGPCVTLWRASRRITTLPAPAQRAAAVSLVNWRDLHLDPAARTASLARPGMRLDLGGIAKGYAADRAVRELRRRGYNRCLVSLAGDIAAGDAPPGKPGWLVTVESCDPASPTGSIRLANAAVSTSGGCEQFVEIDGVRYAHIVDPRTGLGSPRTCTVTVIAPRGEQADALSTAAFLLGPVAAGEALRAVPGAAAVFTDPASGPPSVTIIGDGRALRWSTPPIATVPPAGPPPNSH